MTYTIHYEKNLLLKQKNVPTKIGLCSLWLHGNLPRPEKHATGMFFTSLRSAGLFDSHTIHYEKNLLLKQEVFSW